MTVFALNHICPLKLALTGVALTAFYPGLTDYVMLSRPMEINSALLWLNLWGRLGAQDKYGVEKALREICDPLVLMSQGTIVAQGAPEAIMTPALVDRVFHIEAQIHPDPVSGKPMSVVA
ncbi:iron dicitrate ABC transporter ATP-binding protein [Buttiauxella sp.]|uniref:iron dicitrate ABC transporter ATP-binding protein n=1 Tax=Buttiauxella sp. TaxID=1972222 RepID=UPI003C75ABBC